MPSYHPANSQKSTKLPGSLAGDANPKQRLWSFPGEIPGEIPGKHPRGDPRWTFAQRHRSSVRLCPVALPPGSTRRAAAISSWELHSSTWFDSWGLLGSLPGVRGTQSYAVSEARLGVARRHCSETTVATASRLCANAQPWIAMPPGDPASNSDVAPAQKQGYHDETYCCTKGSCRWHMLRTNCLMSLLS